MGRWRNFVHESAVFRGLRIVWTKCRLEKSSLWLDDPLLQLHLPRPYGSALSTWTKAVEIGGTIVGSKSKDDKVGDGATSSEAMPSQSAELAESILRMVAARVTSPTRALAMDVSSTDMLRDHEERDELLRDLVMKIIPDDVNPDVWDAWLTGGPAPFDGPGIERVVGRDRGLSRPVMRAGTKRRNALTKFKDAEAKLNQASKNLDNARAALEKAVINDAALLEYVVTDHLVSILQPIFAMGPAWTLMRSMSAHVPEKVYADATVMTAEEDIPAEREKIAKERSDATEKMLGILDLWSGDVEFEEELRTAIAGVVARYEKREREGRSMRSQNALRKGIADPDLASDREAVTKGMKKRG